MLSTTVGTLRLNGRMVDGALLLSYGSGSPGYRPATMFGLSEGRGFLILDVSEVVKSASGSAIISSTPLIRIFLSGVTKVLTGKTIQVGPGFMDGSAAHVVAVTGAGAGGALVCP